MTRNYARKNTKSNSGIFKQTSIVFASLVVGYLSATVCDVNTLSTWFNQHVRATQNPPVTITAQASEPPKPKLEFYTLLTKDGIVNGPEVAAIPASVPAPTPAPKIAVTTDLVADTPHVAPLSSKADVVVAKVTDEKKPVLNAVTPPVGATAERVPVVAVNNKNAFVLQIAAFKNKPDADKMRVALMMKGFDVSVATVNQPTGNWYRVVMGPFSSRTAAETAQVSIARSERITGMIRKMDV